MKYFVTYQTPHQSMDEWFKKPEAERKGPEEEMQSQWNAWTESHKNSIIESAGVSKPKRLTASGMEDGRNDLMMYSFVEADSIEAAAEMFKDHPHLTIIPGSWIEVMQVNSDI